MNKCLNCGIECNEIYCDSLCQQGFRNRMYKAFESEWQERKNGANKK